MSEQPTRLVEPWPIVAECYGHYHRGKPLAETCQQCDGSHDHVWRAGVLRSTASDPSRPLAVRCIHCGARKCDLKACLSRRHHGDPHTFIDGTFRAVGT